MRIRNVAYDTLPVVVHGNGPTKVLQWLILSASAPAPEARTQSLSHTWLQLQPLTLVPDLALQSLPQSVLSQHLSLPQT